MIWMYYDGRLMACKENSKFKTLDIVDVEIFEHLTGKKINWNAREFTKVVTIRIGRTLKAFDEKFIEGEEYKYNKKIYKCEHVNKDGTALLTPRGNALKATTARDTKDWEIL